MESYRVIGLMSGSSLDGLDIAYCEFRYKSKQWEYTILESDVAPFTDEWMQDIKGLTVANAKNFWQAHVASGTYFGQQVKQFIEQRKLQGKVDFVASHGHTIFHFPDKHFTTQIADGAAIAAHAGVPVVCDFRSTDIANGGQGTPIVPIGDKLLFADYRFCLNIGGIANISCKVNDDRIIAFDICTANQVLNVYANRLGKEYDEDGAFAKQGMLNQELLDKLNSLDFYDKPYPKSLDNSYSREVLLPIIEQYTIPYESKLCTFAEHIAMQIAKHIDHIAAAEGVSFSGNEKLLATGGGAFNKHLIERIQAQAKLNVVVPDTETVKFKEALVIAFMGVLRMRGEVNVLKSVTGATKDSIGGAVYL